MIVLLLWAQLAVASPLSGIADVAGFDPYWDYKTLETEHFRITFHAEIEGIAKRAAPIYEEAHALLKPILRWTPKTKTQVTLIDNTDLANGFAAPVGRIGMVLYITPPETYFSTNHYDDWLRLLIIHEYTHYLNIDITREVYSGLRLLFGDVFLPNALLPSWMLEGLAVYFETRFTRAGRGRSPYYSMVPRTAVHEDQLDRSSYVTLDRINGGWPYPPGGEIAYLFGYELMQHFASQKVTDLLTADRSSMIVDGEDALGELSYRSARRFPYLINGNAENVIGKSWDQLWREWVSETEAAEKAAIAKLKSQPLSETRAAFDFYSAESLGSALSRDEKWIAWTADPVDARASLYLKNLETGAVRTLRDKNLGSGMAFLGSDTLFFSEVGRYGQYRLFSDLWTYDLKSGSFTQLTHGARARDPDVFSISETDARIAYTVVENTRICLAEARLSLSDETWTLSDPKTLYCPNELGRITSPKYAESGRSIYFSIHPNGQPQEDLLRYDLESGKTITVVSDGSFNQHPFVHGKKLYFTSDKTGVRNLYELDSGSPRMISNTVSGFEFPVAGSSRLLANHYSTKGWQLVEVQKLAGLDPSKLTLSKPQAPKEPTDAELKKAQAEAQTQTGALETRDYSIFPSILPRQWFFLPASMHGSWYFTAQASGFDAVDRHRYFFGIGWDTLVPATDAFVAYQNRSLGPTLTLQGGISTPASIRRYGSSGSPALLAYERKSELTFEVSQPFLFTRSVLTPAVSFEIDQSRIFSGDELIARSRTIPSVSAFVAFSNTKKSRLGFISEAGRNVLVGGRTYAHLPSGTARKFLIKDTEYLHLGRHVVLSPGMAFSATSGGRDGYDDSYVLLRGRRGSLVSPLLGTGLDRLTVRGYPGQTFRAKSVALATLDLHWPIAMIFRGSGTYPLFFEKFTGFVFGDLALPQGVAGTPIPRTLPGTGGGLRLSWDLLLNIPILTTAEYHYGFRKSAGGRGELILTLGLGALPF